jgi:hypothetical protein
MRLGYNGSSVVFDMRAETNLLLQDDGTTEFTFDLSGTDTGKATAEDWIATSDERLKTDIKWYGPVLPSLDKMGIEILQRFTWIEKQKEDVGYIAQWMQPHFPEFVHYNGNTSKYALSYGKMSILALQAVVEQRHEYKKKIRSLETRLRKLEKLIK